MRDVVRIPAGRDDAACDVETVEVTFLVPAVDAGGEESADEREDEQQSRVRDPSVKTYSPSNFWEFPLCG